MNKRDLLAYQLLQFFSQNNVKPISTSSLAEIFNTTPYKIEASIATLNADLQTITANDHSVYVSEKSYKGIWSGHNLFQIIVDKVKLYYIERSTAFRAMEYLLFYNDLVTPKKYIPRAFSSRAVFYRQLTLVKQLLTDEFNNLTIQTDKDREFQIRLEIIELYEQIYKGLKEPFPELDPLINGIFDSLTPFFKHQLQHGEKFKLSIFLRIWILRHNNHKYVRFSAPHPLDDKRYDKIYHVLKQTLGWHFKLTHSEMLFLYGFLLNQDYLDYAGIPEDTCNYQLINKITDDFLNWIKSFNILADFPLEVDQSLRKDITNVNLKLFSYYAELLDATYKNSIHTLRENYPTFDILIQQFWQKLAAQPELKKYHLNKYNLYYGYMLALANNIPAKYSRDRVRVVIDFSKGSLYSQYVDNTLKSLYGNNVILTNHLEPQFDLFLSDTYSYKIKIPQLIWKSFPTVADWTNLITLIKETRSAKARQFFK